jgi:hypothetical protein
MMTLKESIELVVRKSNRVTIVDKTTGDLVSDIKSVLLENGVSSVTVIDARTLYDKNDFRRMLNAIQDGILIIDHATEVPESKHRDIINALIRACLKGDYLDVTEEWMMHFAETKIGVAAIVDKNDYNAPVFKEIFPIGGGCGLLAFTDDGPECF